MVFLDPPIPDREPVPPAATAASSAPSKGPGQDSADGAETAPGPGPESEVAEVPLSSYDVSTVPEEVLEQFHAATVLESARMIQVAREAKIGIGSDIRTAAALSALLDVLVGTPDTPNRRRYEVSSERRFQDDVRRIIETVQARRREEAGGLTVADHIPAGAAEAVGIQPGP